MKEIVQEGAEVLREVAAPVEESAFGSEELAKLVADMTDALEAEPDGVALAAPQVGVSERVFIVRMDRVDVPLLPEGEEAPAAPRPALVDVYVNPEIVKTSRRRQTADEGCLSVRGIYGTTHRHERVTLRARREDGSRFERGAGGLLAQIFEHEVDHLNGVLFIDAAEDLVEVRPHELAHESAA
ncbi:MAG: peptide deformylase [Patescibacteria group bacterium]|nr:peptide deformylase [Patescibacteria group bacterium]MDE1944450.1 peptide deformylase [Patescibacteria group bacterium]MDE1945130.1 peptide deformylase [Patescibacteria group bacterium]MDE2057665.1 peptide deformylase [Patescibacteria group bacterium]